jgi:hypothetical protein
MNLPVTVVLCLKILFIFSALLKLLTPVNIPKIKTEVKVVRFLYYNASLLLFLYWFNPWSKEICLKGEDKMIVFSFMVIELIEEIFPKLL